MRVIGEAHQKWAPLRRKYNLFLLHENPNSEINMGTQSLPLSGTEFSKSQQLQLTRSPQDESLGEFCQFAYVDEPFLSWDFSLLTADKQLIGSVNRNFSGFAREIFTDTGVYALRMDSASLAEEHSRRHLLSQTNQTTVPAYDEKRTGMTLDQRAVMLAAAVSIDFDYFSRHTNTSGIMPFPFPFFGFGGSSAEGAVAGSATGADEVAAGGAAAAGTIAGYDALQQGMDNGQPPDAQGPVTPEMPADKQPFVEETQMPEEKLRLERDREGYEQHPEVWGNDVQNGNDDDGDWTDEYF